MRYPDHYFDGEVKKHGRRTSVERNGRHVPVERNGRHERVGDPEEILGKERGQFALSWFIEQGGVATLDTWAAHIASWEEDVPLTEVTRNRELHYYAWLYFSLVPCLEREGLVEYDGDAVESKTSDSRLEQYRREVS